MKNFTIPLAVVGTIYWFLLKFCTKYRCIKYDPCRILLFMDSGFS
uniref:Uncharacterized protein n=1 Tax=Arundo donax TaxID=35708 RepID=A0A0A9FKI2_ARUDO